MILTSKIKPATPQESRQHRIRSLNQRLLINSALERLKIGHEQGWDVAVILVSNLDERVSRMPLSIMMNPEQTCR